MLTFRVGAASTSAAGKAMAEYLLDAAIPREQAKAAAYYSQGPAPLDEVGRINAAFADAVAQGTMTRDEAVDLMVEAELRRVVPVSADPSTGEVAQVYARMVAAGIMSYSAASDAMTLRIGRETGDFEAAPTEAQAMLETGFQGVEQTERKIARRLDAAVARATHERDYVGAVPELRRDMNPKLAALLGIEPAQAPSTQELAHLLSGQRADGGTCRANSASARPRPKAAWPSLTLRSVPTRA